MYPVYHLAPIKNNNNNLFAKLNKLKTRFSRVSEKRRRARADGVSETVFEVASRFCSEIGAVIGLPFIIVLAVFLQLLR